MKQVLNILALCICSLLWTSQVSAQAPNCFDSYLSPFCSGIAQYPANFDGTGAGSGPQAPVGPNYDCLGTQGNPSYFSLTIESTGSVDFTLDNSANVDIDFILWGPFASIADAQLGCDSMGNGGIYGGVADCSYSAVGQEPVSIPGAQAGEVYILMVTNFSNTATNIFSTSNTGTGGIACPCDIPYTADTMSAANGNMGYLIDTVNGLNQYLVCPNMTLGIQLEAKAALNDTLSLYGPFTTVNNSFPNNSVFAFNPNAPTSFDSLTIFALLTPDFSNIGVSNFTMGMQNDLYTGGLTDSTCFDLLDVQVIVPGVQLSNRNVCSGDTFQVATDSIPTTSLGSSVYAWSQLSGPTITFDNPSARQPMIQIPTWSSTSVGDSIMIEVDYTYGALCPMKDTMTLYFQDVNLTTSATPDTICVGQTSSLQVVLSDTLTPSVCDDYNVTPITFAPVAGSGTSLTLGDDQLSGILPIGFNFNFYCNNYSNFYISSNGFITFDAGSGNGCCSGQTLPDGFTPNDVIAMCWTDCNPTAGGTIQYFTVGAAPNRQLIVNFTNVPPFSASTGNQTVQAILYEGSNIIDLHVTNATPSGGFSGLTLGLENATGTLAHPVPGANAGTTTLSNVAYRFAPKNFGPFFAWTPSGTLSAANVSNPIATPTATTTYSVVVSDGACNYMDTTIVYTTASWSAPTVTCDSSGLTTLSFSWTDLGLPPTGFYEYSVDGGTTWIQVGTALNATATGLMNNTAYTIMVRGNDGAGGPCPLSPAGTNTCTTLNPDCIGVTPVNITLTPSNLLCNGDSTGCISAVVTGGTGNPMNLAWSNGVMDMDSICDLTAGSYTLVVTDTFSSGGGPPSQTTVYAEAFDGVHNWTLNVPTGTNGADNNFWETDSDEAGMPVGACGTAGGPNRSLHITSVFFPTGGAAYDAGGLCPFLFCPETNMRAESPTFSTIGQSNLTLEFNYIANGSGLIDNASVWYNDGVGGWQLLDPSLKSNLCPGGQGEWTKFSMALPASCDNQAAVQVGINWTNNDDGVGTDPSVAIDSILVFTQTSGSSLVSCVDSMSITLVDPTPVVVTIDSFSNPFCSGSADGYISITPSGGTPGYSYNWSNTDTIQDISGLNDGTYTVTVSDANNCTATASTTLTVPNPISITIDSITNNSCDSTYDGAVDITVSGGAGGFSFLWSNGMTTEDLTAVPNNDYVVTVTDGNGCSDTAQVLIVPTIFLQFTDTVTNPLCNGDNGSATITVSGGTGTYTFDWGAASTATTATATITTGFFTVTVTDSGNGCTGQTNISVTAPTALTLALTSTTNIGCNDPANSGALDITVGGGTPGYTYLWSNTALTEDVSGLTSGNYTVTVTDLNGCTITDNAYPVTQATAVSVNISTIIGNLACDQLPIGSLTAMATGGTGISYSWNNGATDANAAGLAAGTYAVTATNSDGCTDTASASISAPVVPTVNPYVSVVGMTSVSAPMNTTIDLNAGSTGFNYNWVGFADPTTGNPNISNSTAAATTASPDPEGTYTYVVTASATTNDTTCTASDTVWIMIEAPFQGIPDAFSPNGDDVNEYFTPIGLTDAEVITFRVFNRWSQEIYNGDENHGLGWDGTFNGVEQPTEVYLYLITYKKASDSEPTTIRGEVTLLR